MIRRLLHALGWHWWGPWEQAFMVDMGAGFAGWQPLPMYRRHCNICLRMEIK